jgi:hypothetical protein
MFFGIYSNQLLDIRCRNSNLLYEFYKTPFCRTRFLEHEELAQVRENGL